MRGFRILSSPPTTTLLFVRRTTGNLSHTYIQAQDIFPLRTSSVFSSHLIDSLKLDVIGHFSSPEAIQQGYDEIAPPLVSAPTNQPVHEKGIRYLRPASASANTSQ